MLGVTRRMMFRDFYLLTILICSCSFVIPTHSADGSSESTHSIPIDVPSRENSCEEKYLDPSLSGSAVGSVGNSSKIDSNNSTPCPSEPGDILSDNEEDLEWCLKGLSEFKKDGYEWSNPLITPVYLEQQGVILSQINPLLSDEGVERFIKCIQALRKKYPHNPFVINISTLNGNFIEEFRSKVLFEHYKFFLKPFSDQSFPGAWYLDWFGYIPAESISAVVSCLYIYLRTNDSNLGEWYVVMIKTQGRIQFPGGTVEKKDLKTLAEVKRFTSRRSAYSPNGVISDKYLYGMVVARELGEEVRMPKWMQDYVFSALCPLKKRGDDRLNLIVNGVMAPYDKVKTFFDPEKGTNVRWYDIYIDPLPWARSLGRLECAEIRNKADFYAQLDSRLADCKEVPNPPIILNLSDLDALSKQQIYPDFLAAASTLRSLNKTYPQGFWKDEGYDSGGYCSE